MPRREVGEAAVALCISHPAAVRRCRATSSTRRTEPAEQSLTVEPIIETAPLFSALTTPPPHCGCEERERGETAVALCISHPAAVRRCRETD